MQLRRKSGSLVPPTNPNNVQRRQHQETQHDLLLQPSCYSDEQYSDIGYPSLPRPKAILSLSRASLPWSTQQASMLGTVPVRVRKSWKTESKLSCVSQCAPAEQSVKVNSELPQTKQRKRKSLSGIADLFRDRSCSSPAGLTGRRRNSANPITSGPASVVVDQMSNHSKVQSRREAQGSTDGGHGQEESQQKSKKSRKPSKSLTFSFGSGSDRKRRTLGLLGRGNRKTSPIPPTTPVTPNSPILVSRKAKTLPVNASLNYKEVPVHPKFNSSLPLRYGSYQDVTGSRSPSRGKRRPPPLRNLSGSVGQHLCHTTTDTEDVSPLTDYSPGLTSTSGGMSSRPDSIESLSISAMSEASRTTCSSLIARTATPPASHRVGRESPMVSRSTVNLPPPTTTTHYKSPTSRRKLSEPTGPGPGPVDVDNPSAPPQPRLGRTLKKRYTFCVRPSQLNAEKEWVR